jgi:cholesterol oxidase
MDRREFGRRILELGALLGLRNVSAAGFAGLGLPLSACGDEAPGAGKPLGDAGHSSPDEGDDGGSSEPGDDDAGQLPGSEEDASGPTTERSVIIIGSGYGSAVTALRLTERGIPVTILEAGRLWKPQADGKTFCPVLAPDGRAMWFKDRTEVLFKKLGPIDTSFATPKQAGIIDVSGPESMRVYRGRGVGGGSLVNLAVFVEALPDVLKRVLPDVDTDSMYGTYYPRAKATLRASQVPDSLIEEEMYRYSRVGIEAAKATGYSIESVVSGYDYDYLQKEVDGTVPPSASVGEGGFGNNYGKRSLDKTYLADAMGTGLLTILPLHEATRIKRIPAGGYVVSVREIDIDGNVLAEKEMPCSHLFVGGGSMGTSELMLKSRERGDLPDLNMHVGTQWGPNSDIFVARDNPVWRPTGSTQCCLPSSSFRTRDADGKHVFSMIIPLPMGIEHFISFNIMMTESSEAGHFVYDPVKDSVELKWDAAQAAPAVKTARYVFDAMNVKTGTSYHEGLFDGPTLGERATYHPVGGCPLGKATDGYGRFPAYSGLYVVDGSLIPVGLGANPSLTITALAERNIERILQEDFKVSS